jgi:hypothetical protein
VTAAGQKSSASAQATVAGTSPGLLGSVVSITAPNFDLGGRTVVTGPATVWDSPLNSIADLKVGTPVQVCGSLQADGSLLASRVDAIVPDQFVVTISEIALERPDGSETVLSTTPTTTDLLKLAQDTPGLVGVAVQPGPIQSLRYYLAGGYVQVGLPGGTSAIYATSPTYPGLPVGATVTGALTQPDHIDVVPSGGTITTGTEAKLLATDFDVSQVFGGFTDGGSSWAMGSTIQSASFTFSGNITATAALGQGVTLPMLNNMQVTLADFTAVLTSSGGSEKTLPLTALGPGSATFGATFKYLLPGPYTLTLQAPTGMSFTTSPTVPAAPTVSDGQNTQEDFTITSASAP